MPFFVSQKQLVCKCEVDPQLATGIIPSRLAEYTDIPQLIWMGKQSMAVQVTEKGYRFCLLGRQLVPNAAVALIKMLSSAILFFTGPAFSEEHVTSHADFLPVIASSAFDGEGRPLKDFSIDKIRLKTPASLHHLCQPFDPQLWIEIEETCSLVARIGSEGDGNEIRMNGTVTLYNPITAQLSCKINFNRPIEGAQNGILQLDKVPLGENCIGTYESSDPSQFPLIFAYSSEPKADESSKTRHTLSIVLKHSTDGMDSSPRKYNSMTSDAPLKLLLKIPSQIGRIYKDPDNLSHRTFLKMEMDQGSFLEWKFMRIDQNMRYTLVIDTDQSEVSLGPVQVYYILPGLVSGMRLERIELFKDQSTSKTRIGYPSIRTVSKSESCHLFLD